jgi:hypothetical protein
MADEVTPPEVEVPAQDAGALAASAVVDTQPAQVQYTPEQVAQLEAAAMALYQENQKYSKYKDKFERLESDPEYREFVDESTRFYEDGRKRKTQPEEAPSWFKPYAEAIDEFRSDRSSTLAQQRAAQEADLNKFYSEQRGYAQRLKSEHKLTDADVMELSAIADTLAAQRGKRVGLEEAFRSVSRFGAGTLETPPPVLRGNAGVGGVPAPTAPNTKENMRTADGRRATILSYIKQNS